MDAVNDMLKQAFEAFGQGKYARADELCAKITESMRNHYGAIHLRGLIAQRQANLPRAIELMRESIRLAPQMGEFHNNLGETLRAAGDQAGAKQAYLKAIELSPQSAEAYSNLGNALRSEMKIEEAIAAYQKAISIAPSLAVAHHNLAEILQELGKTDEAIAAYEKAIAARSDYVKPMIGLGVALMSQRKPFDAIEWYRKAIELEPNNAEAHWNLSLALLLTAQWDEGWKEYEWRWRTQELTPRNFHQPMWNGQDLRGKRVLIHAEQGLGDTIQFVRYAATLAERGATVILECQKQLAEVLATTFGVSQVIRQGDPLPEFDYHVPLSSFPHCFGTTLQTIPAKVPYISVPASSRQDFPGLTQAGGKFKIGLVWAGALGKGTLATRTMSLKHLKPLTEIDHTTYFSLQLNGTPEIASNGLEMFDWGFNFTDIAAAIARLDLVITVDTSIAHLAGAMGAKVWTLLPYAPDFRWLLDRDDSPWYPTMRLFRQTRPGQWNDVIDRVTKALMDLM